MLPSPKQGSVYPILGSVPYNLNSNVPYDLTSPSRASATALTSALTALYQTQKELKHKERRRGTVDQPWIYVWLIKARSCNQLARYQADQVEKSEGNLLNEMNNNDTNMLQNHSLRNQFDCLNSKKILRVLRDQTKSLPNSLEQLPFPVSALHPTLLETIAKAMPPLPYRNLFFMPRPNQTGNSTNFSFFTTPLSKEVKKSSSTVSATTTTPPIATTESTLNDIHFDATQTRCSMTENLSNSLLINQNSPTTPAIKTSNQSSTYRHKRTTAANVSTRTNTQQVSGNLSYKSKDRYTCKFCGKVFPAPQI
ncbi:hypothetical protein EVAR_72379_1 [Eumeta japonica]|uniref:Uncharacterized protein n=1 Tax=Eumeta variegata TaxID=151549 RepID=A0A4C1TCP8_EUMVA|nr:hypothetical protein EVAR_72379_1 [Eumeta japonica]